MPGREHMNRLEQAKINYYRAPNYCKNCGKLIEVDASHPPSEAARMKFCNRSCSAIYNNKEHPKRIKGTDWTCPICGKKKHYTSNVCMSCKGALATEKQYQTPVKDFVYDNGNARVKYSQIRKLARKFLDLWKIPQVCIVCGYDIHVQACHIIPISEFEINGRIIDVNNPNNLVYLCPNHHWELDHGYLNIDSIV